MPGKQASERDEPKRVGRGGERKDTKKWINSRKARYLCDENFVWREATEENTKNQEKKKDKQREGEKRKKRCRGGLDTLGGQSGRSRPCGHWDREMHSVVVRGTFQRGQRQQRRRGRDVVMGLNEIWEYFDNLVFRW